MIWNWFSAKVFFTFALVVVTALPLAQANAIHTVEKRQIGVLARTGALPQGKRSVEVLARNGELPPLIKKEPSNDQTLDLLIRELGTAEAISKLRIQALAERLLEEREFDEFGDLDKRSVSALARNGELPQKRTGYLIKPPQETVQPPTDLLDPDDFLAAAQTSNRDEYLDGPATKNFFLGKKSLGLGRNVLIWRKAHGKSGKRNLASLARDGGLSTLKHSVRKSQDWDDGFDFDDFHRDDKKNVGATKNFGKREISENCLKNHEAAGSKGLFQTPDQHPNSRDKGSSRRKRNSDFESSQEEYEMPTLEAQYVIDYDDFPAHFYNSETAAIEKRFLGRIPQLGRMNRKVQSPSPRRRPHLRPNWL